MVAIVVGKVLTIEATRLILEGGCSSIIVPVGLEVDPRWVGHSVTVMVDKRDSEWVATSVRLRPRHACGRDRSPVSGLGYGSSS
jgi:hypothetical protein